jgi:hypothetical protein
MFQEEDGANGTCPSLKPEVVGGVVGGGKAGAGCTALTTATVTDLLALRPLRVQVKV